MTRDLSRPTAAVAAAGEDPALSCTLNSFTGNTRVLLGDGKTVPISKVKAREKVTATDPYHHVTAARPVAKVIPHHRWHAMAAVVLVTGAVIHATSQHPFWDATTHQFTYAADLRPGDRLLEPDGATVAVKAVRHYQADLTAYNLDVSGMHTYYVLAGTTPVLVHNSCGDAAPESVPEQGSASVVEQGVRRTRRQQLMTPHGCRWRHMARDLPAVGRGAHLRWHGSAGSSGARQGCRQ